MPETRRPVAPITRGRTSGLSLASVTAVIKHLIENGLASRNVTSQLGGDVTISALPPDRIPSGGDERAQLNIFLHQVTPHVTLARARDESRGGMIPALSVELHYLITAFGAQDYQSEILLGHAIGVLHEASTLTSEQVRELLKAVSTSADRRVVPPALATLAQSDLADQIDELRILPEFLNSEEISKLWSALQARFRPSVTYKVTSVPAAHDSQ
jgi:Pvc16 N-terminal domain